MRPLIDRLHTLTTERRRWVLAVWAVLLVCAAPFSIRQTDHLTQGGFMVPGSASARVDQTLERLRRSNPNEGVVLVAPAGARSALAGAVARVERTVAATRGARLAGPALRRASGGSVVEVVPLTVASDQDRRVDTVAKLRRDLRSGKATGGVRTYVVGEDSLWAALHDVSKQQLTAAERVGMPLILIVLLGVFGTLAAAALPLALGAVSVTITGAAVYFLSQATAMSVFVSNAASMLGIGVAVDYSLFVLARYRQRIAAGDGEDEARATALRTSGLAVVFSGATVVISLLGLFLANSTTMRSMALGMIVVVAISVLAAVTLLPALIGLFGRRVYAEGRIRGLTARVGDLARERRRRRAPDDTRGFWTRWSDRVMRRPVLCVVGASAAMLVLAIPTLGISLNESAIDQFSSGSEPATGARYAAAAFGPGALGPVEEVVRFRGGTVRTPSNASALRAYAARIERVPGVTSLERPEVVAGGRSVVLTLVPDAGPGKAPSRALLARLRAIAVAPNALTGVAAVDVGGNTALTEDFVHLVAHSIWKIALFIVVLSYLILLVMLRSALLPLKAVFMTLLSVASAYGVLVAIFQWGWLNGLFGYHAPGYVDALTPPLLLVVVFGLSMDYEVFLLLRIRERVARTGDDRRAVGEGLSATAGTISSAALIMVAVFSSFAAVGLPSVKEVGFGLAVAIALDATLVRLVLVPATMELLGRWNWWLPRALERRLPPLSFEPAGFGAIGGATSNGAGTVAVGSVVAGSAAAAAQAASAPPAGPQR